MLAIKKTGDAQHPAKILGIRIGAVALDHPLHHRGMTPRKRGHRKGNCTMHMSDYYGTATPKYFKATEFPKEIVVTIKSVDRIEFENDGRENA